MLILTRRKNEAVDLIDRDSGEVLCAVSILELLPNGVVRLGFEADSSVRIVRDNAVQKGDMDNGNSKENDEADARGNR